MILKLKSNSGNYGWCVCKWCLYRRCLQCTCRVCCKGYLWPNSIFFLYRQRYYWSYYRFGVCFKMLTYYIYIKWNNYLDNRGSHLRQLEDPDSGRGMVCRCYSIVWYFFKWAAIAMAPNKPAIDRLQRSECHLHNYFICISPCASVFRPTAGCRIWSGYSQWSSKNICSFLPQHAGFY